MADADKRRRDEQDVVAKKRPSNPPKRKIRKDIRRPVLRSASKPSKKAPRPSLFKVGLIRFTARLTGTTLFHSPETLAKNSWKKIGATAAMAHIKGKQSKTTLDKLSEVYAKATDFDEFKRGLTSTFSTLTKVMRFQSNRPTVSSDQKKRKPRQEQIKQAGRKGNGKITPVRDAKIKKPKVPSPYNTLTSEDMQLRKSIKKTWGDSLSFISDAFKENQHVVESWDDLRDYFQGMNCQAEEEDSDLKRNNGFTIRGNRVLIGKKYMRAEHDSVTDNYKALWEYVKNDKSMKDWREKIEKVEKRPFDRIPLKRQGVIMRDKFALPEPFITGGDVIDREAHCFNADEIKSNFTVKNIENSIVSAQRERVKELKHKLTLTAYEGKEQTLKNELEKAQNIIRNPSYKKWMDENRRKSVISEKEKTISVNDLEKRQAAFMERMEKAEITSDMVSIFEKADGSHEIKVMVPNEINGGVSPKGAMEISLDRYSKISHLPDGIYDIEKETGGLDEIEIVDGKIVGDDAPYVEAEDTPEVTNENEMGGNDLKKGNDGPSHSGGPELASAAFSL